MKRLILVLVTLLCGVIMLNAQANFEVTSQTPLNVRSTPSADSQVIGTLKNGTVIYVYQIKGDWATFIYNGSYAYVNRNYLKASAAKPVQEAKTAEEDNKSSAFQKIDFDKFATHNVGWMIWVILALSVVLGYMRNRIRSGNPLRGTEYVINLVAFILICISELIYFIKMGDERVWFCMPDEIGWLGAIVGFIAFGWVVYNQFFCFFDIMDDLRYNAGDFGLHVGIYSWPAAIVLGLIAGFAEWDSVINWIIGILIVCQIIQIVIIVVDVGEKGGTAYGAFVSFVYLLGAISTIMILLQFILLLIVVAIILFLVCAFLSGASRSKSNGEDEGEYLIDERGNCIEGRFVSYDKFEGYNGKTYERHYNDDFVEKK